MNLKKATMTLASTRTFPRIVYEGGRTPRASVRNNHENRPI